MMPIIKGMLFDHFWVLYLAGLALPYAVLRVLIRRYRAIPFPPLQFNSAGLPRRILPWVSLLFECIIIALLAVVLAGPHSENSRQFIAEEGVDIALALDVSASMQAADFKPSRIEALKKLSADFVKRSGANRIAVYSFARHVFTQSPITTDHAVILELIDGIAFEMIDHTASGGTAIGDALLMAADGLVRQRIRGRDQAIVLVTDGESNMGIDPLIAAKAVRGNGIRLYIIGVGGEKPVEVYVNGRPFIAMDRKILKTSLDYRQLGKIADAAGGKFYRATTLHVLTDIFKEIEMLEKTPLQVERFTTRRYFGAHLALAMLALFAGCFAIEGLFLRRPYR